MLNGLIINKFGDKKYYLNDKYHREDGPAFEGLNGCKSYYINGIRHREDGPAIDDDDGFKFYYLNGIHYSEEDYWKEIKRRKSLNYILDKIKKGIIKC